MKNIPLYKEGLQASRLVLGTMPFGDTWEEGAYTKQSLLDAERALDAALEIGINMIDLADIYTRGKSESIMGELLRQRPGLRDKLIIQSKAGIELGDGVLPTRYNFSRDHLVQAVEKSLKRLQLESLDILLLHRPDPLMEPDEVAEALQLLHSSGKVQRFGVSNMSAHQIRFLQQACPQRFIVNQLEMSLLHSDFAAQAMLVNQSVGAAVNFGDGLMEYLRSESIQIQAWGPLAQGKLSGRDVAGEPAHVQRAAALVAELAVQKETSREAIVLAWLMRHPAGVQTIIGSKNPERIRACRDAEAQAELMSREEWYQLYYAARPQAE